MKNTINIKLTILTIVALVLTSCNNSLCIHPEGSTITQEINLDNFTGINSHGSHDVNITYGETQKISVTGKQNIINRLERKVNNGIWDIELENGCYTGNSSLIIDIEIPILNTARTEGSGNINIGDIITEVVLKVNTSGSGNIKLDGNIGAEEVYAISEGSGNIDILGAFEDLYYLDVNLSGSGNFSGFPAVANESEIDIEGSGNCSVSVEDILNVRIEGSGDVYYKGNPIINANISGSGKVKSAN